ncbi:MAG TPA: Xaa-Pro peptidase family protein [bacterium]|nr:Xaa-Pro peptidase family protein [bacterium]HNS48643.1 Xaa-Pro peptidase family protein [bacterium]
MKRALERHGLAACLLTLPENVGYFTGLFLEGVWVLADRKEIRLFAQPLAFEEALHYQPGKLPLAPTIEMTGRLKRLRKGPVGLESELPLNTYLRLKEKQPDLNLAATSIPMEIRAVKEPEERALMRRAGRITSAVWRRLKKATRPGLSERELVRILQAELAARDAEAAFPPVAGAGISGLFPHAQPGGRRVGRNDRVVFDFGARWRGYCSDLTRVAFTGKKDKELLRRYRCLEEAKAAAEAAAGPGVRAAEVDRAGRQVLERHGLGKSFIHAIGHGVGLSVHERPVLAPGSKDVLAPGMVITIEPGIYLPGWGGLRLEDTFLVTEAGLENLTG